MTGIPDPAPPFDTQRAVENLQAGGFSGAQAAALTRTLVDATANLVTKADLKAGLDELRAPIRDLQRSHSEMKESIREMKRSTDGFGEALNASGSRSPGRRPAWRG